jgi:toxin ParE1/3/4
MKIARYTPEAHRDLDEIAECIALQNLDAAIRFCLAVEDAASKLAEMPGMGSLREFSKPALAQLRSWPIKGFRNYLLFYQPSPDGIEVLRIIHGARDIESILR